MADSPVTKAAKRVDTDLKRLQKSMATYQQARLDAGLPTLPVSPLRMRFGLACRHHGVLGLKSDRVTLDDSQFDSATLGADKWAFNDTEGRGEPWRRHQETAA